MSAFASALKSAVIDLSPNISTIWTVLSEEEQKEIVSALREKMNKSEQLFHIGTDLVTRFTTPNAEQNIYLGELAYLKIFYPYQQFKLTVGSSQNDCVFTDTIYKFVGCVDVVSTFVDTFTGREIKTISIFGITDEFYAWIVEQFKTKFQSKVK